MAVSWLIFDHTRVMIMKSRLTKRQRQAAKKVNNPAINDIKTEENDFEIILFSEREFYADQPDTFQLEWCNSRKKHGSVLQDIDSPKFSPIKKPMKYLTKVGHGGYETENVCMMGFTDHINDTVINTFKVFLLRNPTIKRINLYACRSGLPPISFDGERLNVRFLKRDANERFRYGCLSFAEYFILALADKFRAEGQELPKGLSVVACLGNVAQSNGKPTVSGEARLNLAPEDYVVYDHNSKLCKIDCDLFVQACQVLVQNHPELNKSESTFESESKSQSEFAFEPESTSELEIGLSAQKHTLFATSSFSFSVLKEQEEDLTHSGSNSFSQ